MKLRFESNKPTIVLNLLIKKKRAWDPVLAFIIDLLLNTIDHLLILHRLLPH